MDTSRRGRSRCSCSAAEADAAMLNGHSAVAFANDPSEMKPGRERLFTRGDETGTEMKPGLERLFPRCPP